MRTVIPLAVGVIAALSVLGYGLLVAGELFFSAVAVTTIGAVTRSWTRDRREHALVVAVLGGLLSAAAFAGRLDVVVLAAILAGVAYLGWERRRGRGSAG